MVAIAHWNNNYANSNSIYHNSIAEGRFSIKRIRTSQHSIHTTIENSEESKRTRRENGKKRVNSIQTSEKWKKEYEDRGDEILNKNIRDERMMIDRFNEKEGKGATRTTVFLRVGGMNK